MSFNQKMFKNQSTQTSEDDINIDKYDYTLQLKIQGRGCSNCKTHAIWDDDWQNILIPCTSCAEENNYMWNGSQCLGISGISTSENREQTPEEFAWIIKNLIQPRFVGKEKEFNEYIDKIPENVKAFLNSY